MMPGKASGDVGGPLRIKTGRKEMMMMFGPLWCLAWVLWLGPPASSALAFDLITKEEAGMKQTPFKRDHAAIGRGPSIVVTPKSDELTYNPFELEIRFTAYGGAKIDPDSINIRYWSNRRLSLTQRLKPFYKGNVIKAPGARAPSGKHQVEISVNDSHGFGRTAIHDFTVE